jgi:putative tryptophan/tyrosine transport system substrate-binding protein
VRRRDFVTLLGGTAFMQAFAALAQKAPVRLGFLCACAAGSRTSTALIADINGGLRENGLIEGRDYILETRFVAGHYERFAPFAQELTQGGVSILLVNTIVAVRAAQQVIPPVSVVMLYVHDPVGTGLIASLSRPGGLTTGMATMIEDITPKLLDFQRMIVPGAKVIAALFNPVNPTNPPIVEDLKIRASATGLTVQPIVLRMPEELNTVFSAIVATQADTVHVIADASVMDLIDRIAAFSLNIGCRAFRRSRILLNLAVCWPMVHRSASVLEGAAISQSGFWPEPTLAICRSNNRRRSSSQLT